MLVNSGVSLVDLLLCHARPFLSVMEMILLSLQSCSVRWWSCKGNDAAAPFRWTRDLQGQQECRTPSCWCGSCSSRRPTSRPCCERRVSNTILSKPPSSLPPFLLQGIRSSCLILKHKFATLWDPKLGRINPSETRRA